MSVLNDRVFAGEDFAGVDADVLDFFRDALSREMWRWFDSERERKLLTVRKWFFSFSVRVKDLEPLFVLLFGPRPSGSVSRSPST